jgi:drug/metabolite transporter (DMT)-like permease
MTSKPVKIFIKAIVFLVILCASWGLQQISIKIAVRSIAPALQGGIRSIGAHWFVSGEYLRKTQFAGLCCAFLGIVTAFSESIGQPQSKMFIGDAMLLLAAFFWAAATIAIKASPLSGIRASSVLLYQLVVSAVILPLGAVLLGQTEITEMTPLVLGCMVYQVIWVAFITYLAWFWLVRNYPASKLSAFLFLTPLFGVLEGALLLNEKITYRLLTALAMVSIGIYVVNRSKGRQQLEPVKLQADSE